MSLLKIPQNKLRKIASTVTQARVGLDKSGISLSTKEILKFNLDHALAKDAIQKQLNIKKLSNQCQQHKWSTLHFQTKAKTRSQYLLNPPDGSVLDTDDKKKIKDCAQEYDLAIIVTDGLSSTAIESHFIKFYKIFDEIIKNSGLHVSPIIILPYGRVALSDQIGEYIGAKMSIICIGERPGLSSHDSMGIYTTFSPQIGLSNADRSCISNIRPPHGLSYKNAANTLCALIKKHFHSLSLMLPSDS